MTTKPKVNKFRIRRGAPLSPGQALATTEGATARKITSAPNQVKAAPPRDAGEATMEAIAPDMRNDGFSQDMMASASAADRKNNEATAKKIEAKETAAARTPEAQPSEVQSASETKSEQTIADIRKEGLTGRQLRMARRVAQKHGLTPTSDFDAVKQLRERNIDPFRRANMLELVQNNAKKHLPAKQNGTGTPNLPQVQRQGGKSVAVHKETQQEAPNAAEQRALEIAKIQQDIAKRRRRKSAMLFARLAVFVLLPTLVAGWYYYVLATPFYSTKSEFVIQQAEANAGGGGGLAGMFQGTSLATQQDSTTVQSYLQSRDALLRLDEDYDFKKHYQQEWIDPIQRLSKDATNEAAYRLFKRNVKIGYDPSEGILKMEVIAATPEKSEEFSKALLGYAEEQVDQMTQRLRGDQMEGALEHYDEAERKVLDAQQEVLSIQEELGVLDPIGETASVQTQITQFEVQLSQTRLELQKVNANPRPNSPRAAALQGEIARLESLISDLRSRLTNSTGGQESLAKKTGELRFAEANLATRQLMLQNAAASLESARIAASRQVRYLSLGVAPVAPDEATYPRAFENTALAFLIFAGIYLMIALTASVLREQITS